LVSLILLTCRIIVFDKFVFGKVFFLKSALGIGVEVTSRWVIYHPNMWVSRKKLWFFLTNSSRFFNQMKKMAPY